MKLNKLSQIQLALIASVLLISGMILSSLAEDVVNHETLSVMDPIFGNWLLSRTSQVGNKIFSLVTFLGSAWVISGCTVIIGFCFLKEKRLNGLNLLISSVGGAALLNFILKHVFIRPRPDFPLAFLYENGFSFPSGHAMISTAFYGIIAFLIIRTYMSWKIRFFTIIGSIVLPGLIGFSRIYLGVHYSTDVLAGWAAGVLWLMICILGECLYEHAKHIGKNG